MEIGIICFLFLLLLPRIPQGFLHSFFPPITVELYFYKVKYQIATHILFMS